MGCLRETRESAGSERGEIEREEEEEIKKAKKKGMKLEEYRKWRDREMWTNRINQLKKVLSMGDPLSKEEIVEMEDLEKKLSAAGGPTVAPTDPEKGKEKNF